jgi:hypothetical protein
LGAALSAGSYAAIKLPANSVGSKQIKAKAVTNAKLGNRAVTAPKIPANAVDGSEGHRRVADRRRHQPDDARKGPVGRRGGCGRSRASSK